MCLILLIYYVVWHADTDKEYYQTEEVETNDNLEGIKTEEGERDIGIIKSKP